MDDVTIANRALQAIGTSSLIAALNEGSAEANACQLIYSSTRDSLLRKYWWGFARFERALAVYRAAAGTRENPTGANPVPPTPFLYSYAYPPDCLAPRFIKPIAATNTVPGVPLMGVGVVTAAPLLVGGTKVDFTLGVDLDALNNQKRIILTNQQNAELVYTVRITDPNIFDDMFIVAMVGRLAAQLVIPLSGDKTLAKIAIQDGMMAEKDANAVDAGDSITVLDHTPDWIKARGYAYDALEDYDL